MCWVAWTTLSKPKYAGGLGFRDVQSFNDALLAKIGWRLIREPQSLLARVLLGKYAKDSSFLDCSLSSTASHGWRSILEGRNILRKGLGWVVGHGDKIRVWQDPWLSCESPTTPIEPCSLADSNLRVSDLLCPLTNQWDVHRIRLHLPQYEGTILQIITSSTQAEDSLVWLPETSCLYTTKSGYRIASSWEQAGTHHNEAFDWMKNIWNIKTSLKLKDFLWKTINKAIPLSANLERRGFPAFPFKHCGGFEDDLHTFLLCPFADAAWNLSPTVTRPDPFLPSLATLISLGNKSTTLPTLGLHIPLWPWILWHLWKARNKLCFDDRTSIVTEVVHRAIKDAKEWQEAQYHGDKIQFQAPRPTAQPTIPHFPSGATCYVDAAWRKETKTCGIGDIFRGTTPTTPSPISYSRRFISSALIAEALAVRSAVSMATSSNIKSLTVYSDSLVLISLLKTKESRPTLYGIVFDIYHFSRLFTNISFCYVPRLANSEADNVAKSVFLNLDVTPLE